MKKNSIAGLFLITALVTLAYVSEGFGSNYINEDEASFLVFNRIDGTKLYSIDMCFRQFCDPHLCSENHPGEEFVGCISVVQNQRVDFEDLNDKIEKSKLIYLSSHILDYEKLLEKKKKAGDRFNIVIESDNSFYQRIFISIFSTELKGVDEAKLNTVIPFARYRNHDDSIDLLIQPEVEPIDYPDFKERMSTLLSMDVNELVTSLEWHMYLEKRDSDY